MSTSQSDAVLAVRFYQKEYELAFQTTQENRPMYEMRDFVRIEVPGNQLSIIDTLANEDHKRRFPLQWAAYQNSKGRDTDAVQGTLMRDWSIINAAQVKELEHYRFYTVEQVANASDLQLQTIGMVAGMSPISFREKARAYLSNAKGSAVVMQQAEELARRDAKIQAQEDRLREMAQQMEDMRNMIEGRSDKKGPGRPRKEAQEAA
jgi:hypothetical protein